MAKLLQFHEVSEIPMPSEFRETALQRDYLAGYQDGYLRVLRNQEKGAETVPFDSLTRLEIPLQYANPDEPDCKRAYCYGYRWAYDRALGV